MARRQRVRWGAALALVCGAAAAAPFSTPVGRAADASAFVRAGWAVELSVEGDLNGDAEKDRVLVLLQKEPEAGEDRKRALLVLLARPGGYEVAGTNGSLLA